jgi:hypothetical protein
MKVCGAPQLGARLASMRTTWTGRRFEEAVRLCAFLRELNGRPYEDLALLAERPLRESMDPDFRGIIAERRDCGGTREVIVIRWKQSLSAVLSVDSAPMPDPESGSWVLRVVIEEIVESAAVRKTVATPRA